MRKETDWTERGKPPYVGGGAAPTNESQREGRREAHETTIRGSGMENLSARTTIGKVAG